MKFDRLEDVIFDMPLLPTGLQTIEDLQTVEDTTDINE